MPTKHVVKEYAVPAYYHVYNRASGERLLFRDDEDRYMFVQLLQKHLAEHTDPDELVKTFEVEIIAYCLMGTHFHLLLFQRDDVAAITGFMRSVGTAYAMYYNKKYKSKGHVFQSSFRASHVDAEPYLRHITRYIHLNPRSYTTWPWSSYADYIGNATNSWVHPERVLDSDQLGEKYARFVEEYAVVDRRKIATELAEWLPF